MKKWIVTLLIVLAIGTAAYTVNYWLPPLLAFADDNSVRIEAITNLTQMVLWAFAALAAIVGLWRNTRKPPSTGEAGLSIATAEAGSAVAQGGSAAATGDGLAVVGDVNAPILHKPTFTTSAAELETLHRGEAEKRYLRHLVKSCNVLPLASLGGDEGAGQDVTLDRVYIALDTRTNVPVSADEAQARQERALRSPNEKQERPLTALEAVTDSPRLALLGDPGAGKSTFARQLVAWTAAVGLGDPSPALPWPQQLFPILINLRDLRPHLEGLRLDGLADAKRDQTLVHAVGQHWQEQLAEVHAEALRDRLHDALNDGNAFLVFDGLDEVPATLRTTVRQAVAALLQGCRQGTRVLLTSRTRSYTAAVAFAGFAQQTLAPFDEAQIERFVGAWYDAQASLGRLTKTKADERAADLRQAALSVHLRELASNPMLLTTMAIVHQSQVGLPRERVRLYSQAVDVLLKRWQKHKGVAISPTLEAVLTDDRKLRATMERLAYAAHSQRQAKATELARPQLLELLEDPDFLGTAALADEFLDYVDQRAGLLVGQGGDARGRQPTTYAFPHRTFQEYLAGCHLLSGRGSARAFLQKTKEDDTWQLAALLGAEELLFNRRRREELLDLMYALCPAAAPENRADWRATLWAGSMATLLPSAEIERDHDHRDGGVAFLARVRPRLALILDEAPLLPIERAEAGNALARLGDTRVEVLDPVQMEFVEIPAGAFVMGAGKEQFTYDLPYAYQIARYPVTEAHYRAFVAAGGYRQRNFWPEAVAEKFWSERGFKGRYDNEPRSNRADYGEPFTLSNHPVVGVSWYEALAFCRWLTGELRRRDRLPAGLQVWLPSEPEWEKAARGPSTGSGAGRTFPWGDGREADPNLANFDRTGIGVTSAVGCFPGGRSPFGLEELSGNVWEWTRSLYAKYPYPANGKELQQREALRAGVSESRSLRGGAFYAPSSSVGCAARGHYYPFFWDGNFGFRVVTS